MKKATVFVDKVPMPVYLGEHTAVIAELIRKGVFVGYPNIHGVQISFKSARLGNKVHGLIAALGITVPAVSCIGQGMYGFTVASNSMTLPEFVDCIETLNTLLEFFYIEH